MMMYNEIKQNIIKNFLNKRYLYTFGSKKQPIINNIIENSTFPTTYDYNNDIMIMKLGNDISLEFQIEWGETSYSNDQFPYYKIINIK